MSSRKLRISLGDARESDCTPPTLSLECDAYADHLKAAGVEVIELVGLDRMGACGESGAALNTLEVQADSEAEMLALACQELSYLELGSKPRKHEVYLDDGQFEITALLTGDQAIIRAGVYSDPFDPQAPGNTQMSVAMYIGISSPSSSPTPTLLSRAAARRFTATSSALRPGHRA